MKRLRGGYLRSATSGLVLLVATAGLSIGVGQAHGAAVAQYSTNTTYYNTGESILLPPSVAGRVDIQATNEADGNYVYVQIIGRKAVKSCDLTVAGDAANGGLPLTARFAPTFDANGNTPQFRIGPFGPGKAAVQGVCSGSYNSVNYQMALTDPRSVNIDFQQSTPGSGGGTPQTPPPAVPPAVGNTGTDDPVTPTTYCTSFADGIDDSLEPGNIDHGNVIEAIGDLPKYFTGSIGGWTVAGAKGICAIVAEVSGEDETAKRMFCEAFIGATWGIVDKSLKLLPKDVRGVLESQKEFFDLVDPVGRLENAARGIPLLGEAITDKGCTSRADYPTNSSGGW